jgi:hypothetical protein
MRRAGSESGVTYIQILLIIVTAGILGALVVPRLTDQKRDEFWQVAYEKAVAVAVAQETYYGTHGEFAAEKDSLLTVLPEATALIDPFTNEDFLFGTANVGQDYSVSGGPSDRQILITTEDRWEEFKTVWQKWVDLQNVIREQEAAARAGGRPPPGDA